MKQRPPLVLLLIVLVVFFGLGFLQIMLGSPQDTTAPGEATPTAALPSLSGAIQVLVVGVDDLGSRSPSLRALWLVTYEPADAELYLFGLPINLRPSARSKPIHEDFALTEERLPAERFMRELRTRIDLQPHLVVVLDDLAFARIIDFLGGAELPGGVYSGEAILRLMDPLDQDPSALLEAQIEVLGALAPRAFPPALPMEVSDFMALIPGHLQLSSEPQEAFALLAPLLAVKEENVHILPLFAESP